MCGLIDVLIAQGVRILGRKRGEERDGTGRGEGEEEDSSAQRDWSKVFPGTRERIFRDSGTPWDQEQRSEDDYRRLPGNQEWRKKDLMRWKCAHPFSDFFMQI